MDGALRGPDRTRHMHPYTRTYMHPYTRTCTRTCV
ncbi:hypothetical protein M2271_002326 [Streptomyces sp. LBL]|nr:hypothetical protein [Streptomyces sp. LBL]